jgi:hypothetical protein
MYWTLYTPTLSAAASAFAPGRSLYRFPKASSGEALAVADLSWRDFLSLNNVMVKNTQNQPQQRTLKFFCVLGGNKNEAIAHEDEFSTTDNTGGPQPNAVR